MDTLNKACRNVRYMFDNSINDPVQIRVRELTTNEQWGPAASDMAQLAELSYTKAPVIVADLFLRTTDTHWRVVYKSLLVIDYLVKNGSETVIMACTSQLSQLMDLQHAKYLDNGVEKGQGIRERARKIAALLTDTPALKAERAKAKRIMERVPYQHPQFRNFFNGALPTTTQNKPLSCSERDVELLDEQARSSRIRPASPPSFQRPGRSPPHRTPTVVSQPSTSTSTALEPKSPEEEERQLQMALAASRITAVNEIRHDELLRSVSTGNNFIRPVSDKAADFPNSENILQRKPVDSPSGALLDLIDLDEPLQASNIRPIPDFSELYATAAPTNSLALRGYPATSVRPRAAHPATTPGWPAQNISLQPVRPPHPQTSGYDEQHSNLLRMINVRTVPDSSKNPFLGDLH